MKFRIIVVFLLFFSASVAGAKRDISDATVYIGEEIEYEVSFLGIGIGSIKIETLGKEIQNGREIYHVKAFIKSYEGIPYVGLKTIYESWIDQTLSYSHKFIGNSKFMSPDWIYQRIDFDYDQNFIHDRKWKKDDLFFEKKYEIDKKWNDGFSLLFLARRYSNLGRTVKVPTFINDTASTIIKFTGKKEDVKIDAVDYPVKTVYLNGEANWEGIYGLQGDFEGWFSDDDAHVPIKAYMKVLVGSVKIELVKWKRGNWRPPGDDA